MCNFSLDPARLLIKFGASTAIQEAFGGNTAMHCAIHSKNRVVVNLLIDSGASLDIPNNKVFLYGNFTTFCLLDVLIFELFFRTKLLFNYFGIAEVPLGTTIVF